MTRRPSVPAAASLLAAALLASSAAPAHADTCGGLTTEPLCEEDPACTWSAGSGDCVCGSPDSVHEVVFVMQSSGAIGPVVWAQMKDLVSEMLLGALPASTYVGVVQFSSDTFTRWTFSNNQVRGAIANMVNNLPFLNESTSMKDGIQDAIDIFTNHTRGGANKRIVLLTNGRPNPASAQSPCSLRTALDAAGIKVQVVLMGANAEVALISCLVEDTSTDIAIGTELGVEQTADWFCPAPPAAVCGDGTPGGDEQCDDGNAESGDGCDANCTPTGCGNGVVTAGEACDDGNAVSGDGCDASCTPTGCGNGVVTAGEACDDGNAVDGDGCDQGCVASGCGNGVVAPGEGCDDGNLVDGDGCEADCTPTSSCSPAQLDAAAQAAYDHCVADHEPLIEELEDTAQQQQALIDQHLARIAELEDLLAACQGGGPGADDADGDGVPDASDVCPQLPDPQQATWRPGRYTAGDRVAYLGALYECRAWPFSLWCGSTHSAPGASQSWSKAWKRIGDCGAAPTPPTQPCTSPAWSAGPSYLPGARVQNEGREFQCREWPYSGWCGLGAYEPGVGPAWTHAWTLVRSCP